jgi:hypothetical protein
MKINLRRTSVNLLLSSLLVSATLFALACGKQVETAQKTKTLVNETAAVNSLQTIFKAQTMYSVAHSGDYGTFDQLVAEGSLDKRFAGAAPVLEGYVFTIRVVPQSSGGSPAFAVNADPKQTEDASASNVRHLYVDSSSNTIHANATRPATANDPPLQ